LVSESVFSGEPVGKFFCEFTPPVAAHPIDVVSNFVNQCITQIKGFETRFVEFDDGMISFLSAKGTGSNVFLKPMGRCS
jgi:hypothetical protein